MKLFRGFLSFSLALVSLPAMAQAGAGVTPLDGVWQGTGTVRGGAQVPLTFRISGAGKDIKLALLNGPAAHPEESLASSVMVDGDHVVAVYDYFARKLDAKLSGDTLTGTYEPVRPTSRTAPIPFTVKRVAKLSDPSASPGAPDIQGSWEVATTSAKAEVAWEFRVDPRSPETPVIKSVIQRIDGDTGGLWGVWNGSSYTVGHFTAAGAALWQVTPQPDGTLQLKNMILPAPKPEHGGTASATAAPVTKPLEYIARRPEDARAKNLPKPTDTTQQTTVKNPDEPFAFSFPDPSGKVVSNTDPRFQGKVVIVAIGGSWCPNCHDEAPFLVSLYRKYHAQGLEIVGLDFEKGDPETDTPRLKAFIKHYGIEYPMLTAGTTDELEEKVPQGVNLNCWPTSFFLGRDGKVKEVHAGFAGPGNAAGHAALVKETTALVEKLLAEPGPK
jgi:thiol-disulfide isomerase/thioredoxin